MCFNTAFCQIYAIVCGNECLKYILGQKMQDSVGNLLCYGHDGREPCGLKCQVGEAGGGTDNSCNKYISNAF